MASEEIVNVCAGVSEKSTKEGEMEHDHVRIVFWVHVCKRQQSYCNFTVQLHMCALCIRHLHCVYVHMVVRVHCISVRTAF